MFAVIRRQGIAVRISLIAVVLCNALIPYTANAQSLPSDQASNLASMSGAQGTMGSKFQPSMLSASRKNSLQALTPIVLQSGTVTDTPTPVPSATPPTSTEITPSVQADTPTSLATVPTLGYTATPMPSGTPTPT